MKSQSMLSPGAKFSTLEVGELIGQGGHALVYKATREGKAFVLKVARESGLPQRLERAFLREAAIIRRLNRPGVVRVFESDVHETFPYIVMEYIEGPTLSERIQGAPLSEVETVVLALTLTDVLQRLHVLGYNHGDIKPANVLISDDGKCKLIDFGVAADRSDGTGGEFAGTVLYASPEQCGLLEVPVDGRSDLYSLGVVLHECLAGSPPYVATDFGQIAQLHASAPIPDVRSVRPDVSAGFGAIIQRLLAKDPDDRFPNASALRRALLALDAASTSPQGADPSDFAAPLIGRDAELHELRHLLRVSLQGSGRLAAIHGPPGLGRSRLLEELVAHGLPEGVVVIRAEGARGERVPFGCVRRAIDGYLDGLNELAEEARSARWEAVRRAAAPAAGALDELLPKLASSEARGNPEGTKASEIASIFGQFLGRLAQAAGGLVLLADDVHDFDGASVDVLRYLAEGIAADPLLVIVTKESSAQSPGGGLEQFRIEFHSTFELGALDTFQSKQLLIELLGGGGLAPSAVSELIHRGKGNPRALREYLQAFLDVGALRIKNELFELDEERLQDVAIPTSLVELLMGKVREQDAGSQRIVQSAALFRGSFTAAELARSISDIPEATALRTLERSISDGFLERVRGGGVRFTHAEMQLKLAAELTEADRSALHGRIAETIAPRGDADPDAIYEIAHHYRSAQRDSNPAQAAQACAQAASRALGGGDASLALEYFRVADEFATTAGLDLGLEFSRGYGEATRCTGDYGAAERHFGRFLESCTDPVERAEVRARLAHTLNANLATERAHEQLLLAMQEVSASPPRTKVMRVLRALWDWFRASRQLRKNRIGAAPSSERRRLEITATILIEAMKNAFNRFDDLDIVYYTLCPLPLVNRLGYSREFAESYNVMTVFMGILGKRKGIDRYSAVATSASQAIDKAAFVAQSKYATAAALAFIGDEKEARQRFAELWQRGGSQLAAWDFLIAAMCHLWYLAIAGRMQEAHGFAERVGKQLAEVVSAGGTSNQQLLHVLGYVGVASTVLGDPAAARAALDRAGELALAGDKRMHLTAYLALRIWAVHEQGDEPKELEDWIAEFRSISPDPKRTNQFQRHFYILHAYLRLRQLQRAPGSAEAKARLDEALKELSVASFTASVGGHLPIIRAALRRMERSFEAADELLAQASAVAYRLENRWIEWEVERELARLMTDRGSIEEAVRHAQRALQLAMDGGWLSRERAIRTEFRALLQAGGTAELTRMSSGLTVVGSMNLREDKRLEALLELNLASTGVYEPAEQAKIVLDTAIRALRAQRALLYLVDDATGELRFELGRDDQGQNLTDSGNVSRSILERAKNLRQAALTTGSEDGTVDFSSSAIAYNLRSIIATPLIMRDTLKGVLYLDSQVAKGIFTGEDVALLNGLAGHTAIALERARLTSLELKARAQEKDLEITGLIQSYLLPDSTADASTTIPCVAHYRSAVQSGGDWWSLHRPAPDRLFVALADVTGHGAGPAMVTAALAAVFEAYKEGRAGDSVESFLGYADRVLFSLLRGRYQVSLCCAELNAAERKGSVWFCGSPPAFLRKDGKFVALAAAGVPLGSGVAKSTRVDFDFAPGSRLFVYTDGVSELSPADGRRWGDRQLLQFLQANAALPLDGFRGELAAHLDVLLGGREQDDDISFLLIDFGSASSGERNVA